MMQPTPTPLKSTFLRPSKAPNLLIAPVEYTQTYQDQFTNALRLYFNQIDNFTQAVAVPDAGATSQRPTVNLQIGQQFFDTTLVLPIWWTGTKWINASGTAV
jgi:hypothetical protein